MIPTINFDRTDENGQDAWEIRADDRPVGEVYVGFDTDEEPAQPYINSISVVEEYRHQGIGKQVVQLLADHYGSLTSDPGGNTTSEAHSMWRSVPGARQITVSPYGKEIQIWKIGGKLLEMSRTSQPASNEQKIRMRELLNRGYNHMEAAEMLGLVYTPTGKLVQKQGTKKQAYISSPEGPEEPKWPVMVQKIVEQGGGIWKGLQELGDDRYAAMFNSPSSHSTLMLPIEGLTPEKVQEHIQKDTAKFGSWEHPEEAGSVEDRIADQMEKRSFSEEEVGDDWLEFSRNTDYEGDGTWIRVHYKDGEVTKVECWSGDRSGSPTTREGWDGLVSFTNTYGD